MRCLILSLAITGCSFEHGIAKGSDDGSPSDGSRDGVGSTGSDGSGSGSTGTCSASGQRVCIDATHSGSCNSSLQKVTDRTCPTGSQCANGYCQPPPGGSMCGKASDCSGQKVCDLYIVSGTLVGYCTDPFGTVDTTYTSCTPLSNNQTCETGLCAHDNDGHQQCLVPCMNGNDNTCPGGSSCHILTSPTTIEGTPTTGQYGCFQ